MCDCSHCRMDPTTILCERCACLGKGPAACNKVADMSSPHRPYDRSLGLCAECEAQCREAWLRLVVPGPLRSAELFRLVAPFLMFDRRKLLRLHHLRQCLTARRGSGVPNWYWLQPNVWGWDEWAPNPFLELRGECYLISCLRADGGHAVPVSRPQSPMDRVMQFL